MCIVNVQIHGRVCTPYIASCLEQQLVCIAVPMKVHTLHTLQMKLCTLKILGNTAIQSANQKGQFSFSTREKDFIFFPDALKCLGDSQELAYVQQK